ncbi:MAG: Wzz/FepE/Etk N-terminal domain-containing protein [Ignavibacteria bacterium]|nr:Wzz/FepE/Etk N-terminal domain-containing protein [Ignavibacteria bacterium]
MKFHELLQIAFIHRKKFFSITLFGTFFYILFLIIIYPVTYSSMISILPPEKNNSNGLSSLLQSSEIANLSNLSMASANSQLYAEIIKSRSAAEYVISKLNLYDYLGAETSEEASIRLRKLLSIEVTKEGIIEFSVPVSTSLFGRVLSQTDSIRNLSANISNAYAEALDKINREKLSSKAKKARIYIEDQLVQIKVQLDTSETALMEFQKKNKAISLPEQMKAGIEAAARIKSEMISTEINLGLLSKNLNENNPSIISLRSKHQQLKEQLQKLESLNQDILLSFADAPSLAGKLSSLVRDVKIYNEVYLMLQQQYFKEKIQENRDLPTVEILDPAIPPERASSPRIIFSTLLAAIFIFLSSLLVSVFQTKEMFNYLMKGIKV